MEVFDGVVIGLSGKRHGLWFLSFLTGIQAEIFLEFPFP